MGELALDHDIVIDILHDPIALGKSLRLARKSAGLTQEAVATHLDIARTSIVAIESGQRHVRVEELQALATLYLCDISQFFAQGQEMPPEPVLSARKRVLKRVLGREIDQTMYNTLRVLVPSQKELERMAATLLHMLIEQEEEAGRHVDMAR